MSVQQDWAEDEPRFGSAPVPAPDPLTDPLDGDLPRDPGPVTARATVPPVFDHPVRVVTARGSARPPIPAQARPAPISAPPAQDGTPGDPDAPFDPDPPFDPDAPFDPDDPVIGAGRVNGFVANDEDRVGRHRTDLPDGHPLNPKTVALPAFITGRKEEPAQTEPAQTEPAQTEPARPQAGEKLPPTERGMLVFVAALLALGTVAVVVMLGFGGLTTHHTPAPSHETSPTPAAAQVVAPSPSDSPSPSPSPSLSPSPSRKPAPRPSPTLGDLLGTPNVNKFCWDMSRGVPSPPNNDRDTWACVSPSSGSVRRTFTPDQVCVFQFPDATHAIVGTLTNPGTWRCYK